MVKGVESFQPHVQRFRVGEFEFLLQGQIEILDPGPGKNLRPLLPGEPSAGKLKSDALKYGFPLRGL